MRQVQGRLIEQDITETAAKNGAEHAVEQQVVQISSGNRASAFLDAIPAQHQHQGKCQQVHQAVPAHGEPVEQRKRDRIKPGKCEHAKIGVEKAHGC